MSVIVGVSPQRDPSDHAVPEGEQSAADSGHPAGGDHRVSEHRGQHRELCGRHQQRPLGHRAASHPVPQAAGQDPDRPLRAGELWIRYVLQLSTFSHVYINQCSHVTVRGHIMAFYLISSTVTVDIFLSFTAFLSAST